MLKLPIIDRWKTAFLLLACFILFPAALICGQERTWSDDSGQFEIVAEMIKRDKDTVTLLKENGVEIIVQLSKLSKSDQDYVQTLPELNQSTPSSIPIPQAMPSDPQPLQLEESHHSSTDSPPRPTRTTVEPGNADDPKKMATETGSLPETGNATSPSSKLAVDVANGQRLAKLLKVKDFRNTRQLLEELGRQWPDNPAPELIETVIASSRTGDKFVRKSALDLLVSHPATGSFDAILERIGDSSFEIRWQAYAVIESLGDERAIDPLIQHFTGQDANRIASILVTYGSSVEEKVFPFLSHSESKVRLSACSLLAKTGSEKSLTVLEKARDNDSAVLVRMQAKSALAKIRARQSDPQE